MDLLADEDVQRQICAIQVPARELVTSHEKEPAQGDVLARADEEPASGWVFFHQRRFAALLIQDPLHIRELEQ